MLAAAILTMTLSIPSTYDLHFQVATERASLPWDWRWVKALCWAESSFDPYAVSPAGACGIAQFMPRTWHEACDGSGIGRRSPFEPRYSIIAAAWYLERLRREWYWERPEPERRRLALASYNAGLGSILRAQELCIEDGRSGRLWSDIKLCLDIVTGPKNAHETITYVDRIESFARSLDAAWTQEEQPQ